MNEYELHTQGATHNFTPSFNGRDPMRNRPCEQSRSAKSQPECSVKRYGIQTDYVSGVGIPTMMVSPEGKYVLHADHAKEVTLLRLENDIWRNRTKLAEEKNANTTT